MLFVATASCSAFAWAIRIGGDPLAAIMVIGNILVLGTVVTSRWVGLPRCVVLVAFAEFLAWVTAGQSDIANPWWRPMPFFSPAMLLACLGLLAVWDFSHTLRNRSGARSYRMWGIVALSAGLLTYMIIVPAVDSFLESFRDRPSSCTIEELTLFESLRIRSSMFAVFAIFTYVGACWGSFLHVVAYSVPRGESIALRSSACPKCGTELRRIDNLPIFSYLNLGGRCRDCGVAIPIRYLIVELIGAGIFGSLFLFELVTGAANVPGFPLYHYTGILWIILYTKWPVIGIYFFHAALFCCLLTLALMEMDRKRCPRVLGFLMLIVFAALPVAVATLQPVAPDAHLPFQLTASLPEPVSRAIAGLISGMAGGLLGVAAIRFGFFKRSRNLTLAFTLLGIALGWQAVLTIGVLFGVLFGIAQWFSTASTWPALADAKRWINRVGATAGLLLIALVHHPFWKLIASLW